MFLTYLGIFLLSAATLALEIALTRIFSVAQGYHFAFLAVSLALLGFGASGSALAAWQGRSIPTASPRHPRSSLWAGLFALTSLASYLLANTLPLDSYRLGWDSVQAPLLVLYYLCLAVPFFFSGLVMGQLLAVWPERVPRLYAANLVGSGLGGLLAVVALPVVEGRGIVPLVALLGALAGMIFMPDTHVLLRTTEDENSPGKTSWQLVLRAIFNLGRGTEAKAGPTPQGRSMALLGLLPVALGILALTLLLTRPPVLEPQLSPYKGLSAVLRFPDTRLMETRWNAFSRVDVVQGSALRSAPGLSLRYQGTLPPQAGVLVDGDNLRALVSWPALADFTEYLPIALAYRLLDRPKVLVMEPGGGLDVLAARHLGARSVTAVESNPLLLEAVQRHGGDLYAAPQVIAVAENGRSFLRRTGEGYDLIHLSLADSFRPVAAGSYSLAENYLYTVEAFQDIYAHLSPGGIFMVARWLQLPPSEDLRAAVVAVAALEAAGIPDATQRVAAVRSFQTLVLLVKNGPWQESEIVAIRRFCAERGFDPVYFPGLQAAETNLYSILPEDVYFTGFQHILSPERARFLDDHPYDLSPPTDDHPFYFHTFKWGQLPVLWANLGRTWQPFGGAGYLLLWALLLLVTLTSATAILLPLLMARHNQGLSGSGPVSDQSAAGFYRFCLFLYFLSLGLGYLSVEIPLMQQFILFLGQPTYAFAVVLGTLLVASGVGSMTVEEAPADANTMTRRWAPDMIILVILILAYPAFLPGFFHLLLGQSLSLRILASIVALSPLGFLMGRPFPAGIALVRRRAPGLIPWVWGVNGFASVIASVAAALLALSVGFSWVLWGAAAAYGCAAATGLVINAPPSEAQRSRR